MSDGTGIIHVHIGSDWDITNFSGADIVHWSVVKDLPPPPTF
jgi:hypothetical protein